jgi:ATP-dependent RNA helicase RhlE
MTSFSSLGLSASVQTAVAAEGYTIPTPIQMQAIPHLLAGRDLLGIAQTGTGKTAAFALPIIERLLKNRLRANPRHARALILSPTRELAQQISDSFATYGRGMGLSRVTITGGVGMRPQIVALTRGVDIVVATPGRLLDHMNQGHIRLDAVEVFVLDEADRMLDMGFVRDVKKITAKLPAQRQTLLFSATMPESVEGLAASILNKPERVEVVPPSTTVERIDQKVMFVSRDDKRRLLEKLLKDKGVTRTIVFTRTKHGANRIAEQLERSGFAADAIHGNKSQGARQKALSRFRSGEVQTLVATDIAARGIDVDGISHVINFDLPNEPESYVHRIGRTARAGADGIALSFCGADEVGFLKSIEKLIGQKVEVDTEHPFHVDHPAGRHAAPQRNGGGRPQNGGHKQGNHQSAERRPQAGKPARPGKSARHGEMRQGENRPSELQRNKGFRGARG